MNSLPDAHHAAHRHPIAVVAERTGLSQDLLRVWERRYQAVVPARGPGGQRLYSDADVERLGLLEAATRGGRSISKVAPLSTEALAALVNEDDAARDQRELAGITVPEQADVVVRALALARALDSAALDDALRRSSATLGMPAFVESVAVPLLRRVGEEWHAGRLALAPEHLVTSLLHGVITESMHTFSRQGDARKLLVTTTAGERHAIGAALVGAAAAVEGWNVLYLGVDLPAAEIALAAVSAGVSLVAISIVYVEHRDATIEQLRTLRLRLPAAIGLIAGGSGANALSAELHAIGVHVESTIAGLLVELRRRQRASS